MPEQKEQEPVGSAVEKQQLPKTESIEVDKDEMSPEVESVVEKIERQRKKKNDTSDDVSGTVVPASDDQPAVTLPITKDDMQTGEKLSVFESFRWLVEWARKQVKKLGGRVTYEKTESGEE